jgi:hypothetical protein
MSSYKPSCKQSPKCVVLNPEYVAKTLSINKDLIFKQKEKDDIFPKLKNTLLKEINIKNIEHIKKRFNSINLVLRSHNIIK